MRRKQAGGRLARFGVAAALAIGTGGFVGVIVAEAPAGAAANLYVGPGGGTGNCASPTYATIGAAVTAASSGDTVNVCAGTYHEGVTVTGKALSLIGSSATIDATGQVEGVKFSGPATAGSTLQGFTIENAQREGVLAEGTTDVTITSNVVSGNDLACIPQTGFDDCGEGIHLQSVTNSTVSHNTSQNNSGGISLDDGIPPGSIGATAFGGPTTYFGPTSGNQILNNIVLNNVWDCGITLPSHNSLAAPGGVPNPAAGGVFNNTIKGNIAQNNGTSGGGGSGILIAAPFPGAASYDNIVQGNTVSGNGQAGITIHAHAPAQDVNGNQILGNTVGQNAVGETNPGQGVFATGSASAGDVDAGDPATTGILVYSTVVHVTGTVIQGNAVSTITSASGLRTSTPAASAGTPSATSR